ncbi:flavodoxin domain-containing protein [Anaeromicropila populeti]|uniref:Protoporphyrinogen IX oxidase, menaquinone-dependent (Flavodoxin domain) n=1 Tax=Anaeromicropila populeti TaxID=37658 RepID=A0A1I6KC74_9FIRM|nr:flavodoxin domain-containing protein [Anaeromicropila populeti]SFR88628.1 Protoporphyrinogen IX oxidase, menaquinone-dependent (flavodoxin domain) [Anaeromicropila populeti]
MKRVVVYKSSTGFTKTYAEWIAKELNCEMVDLKKVEESTLHQCEMVIYGGWIMGNTIVGLDKIKKMGANNLVVYAVGSLPKTKEVADSIQTKNGLENTVFFYMPGGFRFEKLNFLIRMMLKSMKKSIAKKENKTETDVFMEKHLGTSFDHSDKKYIEPLIQYVNEEVSQKQN